MHGSQPAASSWSAILEWYLAKQLFTFGFKDLFTSVVILHQTQTFLVKYRTAGFCLTVRVWIFVIHRYRKRDEVLWGFYSQESNALSGGGHGSRRCNSHRRRRWSKPVNLYSITSGSSNFPWHVKTPGGGYFLIYKTYHRGCEMTLRRYRSDSGAS